MKNKTRILMMICVLLTAVLIGAATAEEQLFTDEVELYHTGGFPSGMPAQISTYSVNTFEDYMIAQFNAQAYVIDVSRFQLTHNEFRTAYWAMLNSRPELFFVDGGYGYYEPSPYMNYILPTYIYTGSELTRMQQIFDSGVAAVVNYAMSADTDIGRMLRANDYMCANFEYDTNGSIYSPELLFQYGTGVCQAYMLAYRAVLNELGITNITVTSNEIDHTWNMVYLDGSWYHIDVTWNDPIDDVPLRACHTNFLLSDSGITATGHYGWDDSYEIYYAADSTKYDNYFWVNMNQAAPMKGDVVYYADSDYTTTWRTIYAHNLANGSVSEIISYNYGYYSYFIDYDMVWINGDTLYYALRDSLYSIPVNGGIASLVYSTGNSGEWLWFPFQYGSQLKMLASSSPEASGSVHLYTIESAPEIDYSLDLEQSLIRTDISSEVQLNAILTPEAPETSALEWSTSNEAVATVDQNGLIRAVGAGIAEITVKFGDSDADKCTVIVNTAEIIYLPTYTVEIQSEAFVGTASGTVELPKGLLTIGSRAFADNEHLLFVVLPDSIEYIAEDAFSGSNNVTLLCTEGSYGATFADANEIPYIILP